MKENNKIILIVLADIIIVVLAGWFVLQPQYNKLSSLKETIQQDKEDLETKKQTADSLKLLRKNYSEIAEADMNKVSRVLPKEDGIIDLLPEIETIMSQNGLTISDITFNRSLLERKAVDKKISLFANGETKLLGVSIESGGSYESFKNFIKSIERDERLMDVINITLKSTGKTGGNATPGVPAKIANDFSFTVSIFSYWLE